MWYPAKVITPAASEPITLDEAKRQSRVDTADDDALIERLITAARDHVERYCAVRFAAQTLEIGCGGFADFCRLPEAPVTSIVSVSYIDTAGATQTLDAAVYNLNLDGLEPSISLSYGERWPSIRMNSRIIVTADVGYATMPAAVLHAMLMLVATWYENREQVLVGASVSDLPLSASIDALLCNFRRGP